MTPRTLVTALGLLTGALPREFPLAAPRKLAENLYVLLNPALPPDLGRILGADVLGKLRCLPA